jgi:lipoate-protein ligase A
MISSAKQKVKEGKLVKVEVEYEEYIKRVRITGDFFLHPEDILEKIERSMVGMKKDTDAESLTSKIQKLVEDHEAQMIGVSPGSLALVIREALK